MTYIYKVCSSSSNRIECNTIQVCTPCTVTHCNYIIRIINTNTINKAFCKFFYPTSTSPVRSTCRFVEYFIDNIIISPVCLYNVFPKIPHRTNLSRIIPVPVNHYIHPAFNGSINHFFGFVYSINRISCCNIRSSSTTSINSHACSDYINAPVITCP